MRHSQNREHSIIQYSWTKKTIDDGRRTIDYTHKQIRRSSIVYRLVYSKNNQVPHTLAETHAR